MQFKHLVATLSLILVSLVAAFWVLVINKTPKSSSKPLVVCTTTIIGDAIKQIARDTIDLEILMGPGVDPHLYKPIEQDMYKIAQANIIFYNGLHLEARMGDLFAKMASIKKTVAVCQDIPQHLLIKSAEHAQFTDPHVWFDPRLWSCAVTTITCALQENNPEHHEFYEQNKKEFLKKLKALYCSTRAEIQKIPLQKRILITGHDAFSYFSQAYNCKVVSLQGISTASEAGTQDVQNLVHFIYEHKIPTIFVETSVPSRSIQALQQGVTALGFDVRIGQELYSDALGSLGTAQGTYLGMLQSNIDAITQGLLR